jgi:hypothetical protein
MEGLFGGGSSEPRGPSDAQFGRYNAGAGRAGEDFYGRGLVLSGISENYSIYSSLRMPSERGERRMLGDVDKAVASTTAAVLIDVKKWAAGHTYWSWKGRGYRDLLQPALTNRDGTPKWTLSRNMEIAQERYRPLLPSDIKLHCIVVFVPADVRRMDATVPRVAFLRWPGGIRSYRADESYDIIERLLGAPGKAHPEVDRIFRRLEMA